jgi:sec-independent protein translocase protein TatA
VIFLGELHFFYYLCVVIPLLTQKKKAMFALLFAFIGSLGGWEIMVILLVILLLFGAKRIPELARGLGRGIREFKDATKEIRDSIEEGGLTDEKKKN